MKMTKLLSLLLALVMVASLFAGCGSDDTETKEETTKEETTTEETKEETTEEATEEVKEEEPMPEGLVADITVQVEESWMEYYQKAADRVLEANPDSTINFITAGSFDHLDVLDSTDVTNEDVADVFAIPADRIYGMAQNEALAEIDALQMAANVGGFGDYNAGLGGNFNVNGSYLAFPMNIETLINFANTANAEANGVDLSTTIEFTELNYQDMLVPVFNAWFGIAFVNAVDIELLNFDDAGVLYSDMTKEFADLTQEQQDMFTALFNYWKAHDEAGTDAWDSSATWGYMDAEFSTGGMNSVRLEGPWSTGSLSNLAGGGEDLAILPINQVTVNGNPLAHWKGGWGLAINARNEGDEETMLLAQAMIEEIVNPEFAVDFFEATGKIMENVDPSVYANSDLDETDKVVVAAVIESYQDAPARPLFSEWGSVWGTWETAVLSWAAVKPATVEEAYAEIKAGFEAMMTNF